MLLEYLCAFSFQFFSVLPSCKIFLLFWPPYLPFYFCSELLKWPAAEPFDPIPHQLLRKYICYARRYVNPRLSPAAAKVLQEFYLDLRQNHVSDAIPITTRQLESLIRLTQVEFSRPQIIYSVTLSHLC